MIDGVAISREPIVHGDGLVEYQVLYNGKLIATIQPFDEHKACGRYVDYRRISREYAGKKDLQHWIKETIEALRRSPEVQIASKVS